MTSAPAHPAFYRPRFSETCDKTRVSVRQANRVLRFRTCLANRFLDGPAGLDEPDDAPAARAHAVSDAREGACDLVAIAEATVEEVEIAGNMADIGKTVRVLGRS